MRFWRPVFFFFFFFCPSKGLSDAAGSFAGKGSFYASENGCGFYNNVSGDDETGGRGGEGVMRAGVGGGRAGALQPYTN